ncbi:hypothetical protein CGRA01v4_14219 [Colletotrichum graminicola]|nr:hypothetical protein CGRA01v4_14219 [Colletotrichum graminicola]
MDHVMLRHDSTLPSAFEHHERRAEFTKPPGRGRIRGFGYTDRGNHPLAWQHWSRDPVRPDEFGFLPYSAEVS